MHITELFISEEIQLCQVYKEIETKNVYLVEHDEICELFITLFNMKTAQTLHMQIMFG